MLILTMVLLGNSSYAANDPVLAHGEKLHTDKCTSCHGTEVYTREDRRVNSKEALASQVNNCMKGAAKASWTASETSSVVEYLNIKFYKF